MRDFWTMVWDKNVSVIVMVNSEEKDLVGGEAILRKLQSIRKVFINQENVSNFLEGFKRISKFL